MAKSMTQQDASSAVNFDWHVGKTGDETGGQKNPVKKSGGVKIG